MIVEDDPDTALLLKCILILAGFDVSNALSGQEGIKKVPAKSQILFCWICACRIWIGGKFCIVSQKVSLRNKKVILTPKEFAVLVTLAKPAPRIVRYQAITQSV